MFLRGGKSLHVDGNRNAISRHPAGTRALHGLSYLGSFGLKSMFNVWGIFKESEVGTSEVTYGAEVWTLTNKEEQAVLIFERKIFRRIYGPKYENGEWKSGTNREL